MKYICTMRYIAILFFGILSLAACNNSNHKADVSDIENNGNTPDNPNNNKGPKGTPKFDEVLHDFGNIVDGESVQHKFRFKNTGKGELVVSNVQASCGCTTPEWTRDVIAPGGEGFILATFNSSGKGEKGGLIVEKSITVNFSNSTVETMELRFKSNIDKKE
ncbi:MAG: DUF1573 domain-containing protein [Bacteroidetes bacterium]|nr:DUF1573 domain-containing protein [Bacteroidota bacterium]